MNAPSTSSLILDRLRENANHLDRPEVRLASIQRLVEACDAIESGAAIEACFGPNKIATHRRLTVAINPTNIEKYVKFRRNAGDPRWTGPTRVFLASDHDLAAYVKARESERAKPQLPKRPTDRLKALEDALAGLPTEKLQFVRAELETGRAAQRKLTTLLMGLRSIPAIDVDGLLNGSIHPVEQRTAQIQPALPLTSIDQKMHGALRELLDRLHDRDEMSRAGLVLDGKRLKMSGSLQTTIIRPSEMEALMHVAGYNKAPST